MYFCLNQSAQNFLPCTQKCSRLQAPLQPRARIKNDQLAQKWRRKCRRHTRIAPKPKSENDVDAMEKMTSSTTNRIGVREKKSESGSDNKVALTTQQVASTPPKSGKSGSGSKVGEKRLRKMATHTGCTKLLEIFGVRLPVKLSKDKRIRQRSTRASCMSLALPAFR